MRYRPTPRPRASGATHMPTIWATPPSSTSAEVMPRVAPSSTARRLTLRSPVRRAVQTSGEKAFSSSYVEANASGASARARSRISRYRSSSPAPSHVISMPGTVRHGRTPLGRTSSRAGERPERRCGRAGRARPAGARCRRRRRRPPRPTAGGPSRRTRGPRPRRTTGRSAAASGRPRRAGSRTTDSPSGAGTASHAPRAASAAARWCPAPVVPHSPTSTSAASGSVTCGRVMSPPPSEGVTAGTRLRFPRSARSWESVLVRNGPEMTDGAIAGERGVRWRRQRPSQSV